MRVVFVGPPGAGKGTQSQRLVEYLKIPHLSTGDLLRQAIRDATDVGRLVEPMMEQGQLAPDALVLDVLRERLAHPDCDVGCLLDGVPRTIPQAEAIDRILAERGDAIDVCLQLCVPDDVLIERLKRRAADSADPRPDDRPQWIPRRLEVYRSQTEPLVEFYRRQGKLKTIDGTGTTDAVFERIKSALAELG